MDLLHICQIIIWALIFAAITYVISGFIRSRIRGTLYVVHIDGEEPFIKISLKDYSVLDMKNNTTIRLTVNHVYSDREDAL